MLPFGPFFPDFGPDQDFFEEIDPDLHPVLPMSRFFTTWVVLRPYRQKSCLLVAYLPEKSFICVQGYKDSKMFLSFHYNSSGKLLCILI